jgi:ferritin-like metal-binding protein YciE
MSRSFADLVTTLERRRDQTARQVIRVERVVVEAGGQAIVGTVGMVPAQVGGYP